jgi:predicted ATPase with chaperone activity
VKCHAGVLPIISFCSAPLGLARRLTTILPAMTVAKAVETMPIYRVAGLMGDHTVCVTTCPVRTCNSSWMNMCS